MNQILTAGFSGTSDTGQVEDQKMTRILRRFGGKLVKMIKDFGGKFYDYSIKLYKFYCIGVMN